MSSKALASSVLITRSPLRDEELIRDPAIHRAVEVHRAASSTPARVQSRRWPRRWLLVAAMGVLLIAIVGLIRLVN